MNDNDDKMENMKLAIQSGLVASMAELKGGTGELRKELSKGEFKRKRTRRKTSKKSRKNNRK